MSLKTLLMPAITARLLSRQTLLTQRAKAERQRLRAAARHQVHYFHQVDDPYSALVAQVLPQWLARFDVDVLPHVVSPPPDNAAPERQKLVAYSRKDAALLAQKLGLTFTDHGVQPTPQALAQATRALVAAIDSGRFVDVAGALSCALWAAPGSGPAPKPDGIALALADETATTRHLTQSTLLRQQMGHYLGAMFFYAGEWYWGLDRLHHLEARLTALSATKDTAACVISAMVPDQNQALEAGRRPKPAADIHFFFSLRSPYSAIVAPRVFALAGQTGARVTLRYLLPMVMRGLPVPPEKRLYISRDAAREAHVRGIPFGRLNDPVGQPVERGLALVAQGERQGKGQAVVSAFMRLVWSQGVDAGSDRGLRRIAEAAGMSWADAQAALQDGRWRQQAEKNRADLFALGLWGVPSFQVGDCAVWGQDRLWAVQDELQRMADAA